LVFVKIHPFQNGTGRSERLLEKWFLIRKFVEKTTAIQLEKKYYVNLQKHYSNLRILGIAYELLE
jgi:Fic family protein